MVAPGLCVSWRGPTGSGRCDFLPTAETHRAQRARSEGSGAQPSAQPISRFGVVSCQLGLSDRGGPARAEWTQLKRLSALNELAAQVGEAEVSRQIECRR